MHNRIRIARTNPNTILREVSDDKVLMKGQPFYDVKTKRLFISSEDNKKINSLADDEGITAYKISVPRNLRTNLASIEDVTFDGSSNQENIPVTGILPIANGGTGVSNSTTESDITVKNATLAVDSNNVKNTINNINITDIFESGASAGATTAVVKTATTATKVTSKIGERNISDIFEGDSTTVKSALNSSVSSSTNGFNYTSTVFSPSIQYVDIGAWKADNTWQPSETYNGYKIRLSGTVSAGNYVTFYLLLLKGSMNQTATNQKKTGIFTISDASAIDFVSISRAISSDDGSDTGAGFSAWADGNSVKWSTCNATGRPYITVVYRNISTIDA